MERESVIVRDERRVREECVGGMRMTAMWSWFWRCMAWRCGERACAETLMMCGILCLLTVGALCPDTVCVEALTERRSVIAVQPTESESRDVSHNAESHNMR